MMMSKDFSFRQTLASIAAKGFAWEQFPDVFPFGFLDIREGEYVQLVDQVLDSLPTDQERMSLLDLLDAQWCVYLEQLSFQERFGHDTKGFEGEMHFASARLQLDSYIRLERSLQHKDPGGAMLRVGREETLLDRMLVPLPHPQGQD
jgi:hypothetical protein